MTPLHVNVSIPTDEWRMWCRDAGLSPAGQPFGGRDPRHWKYLTGHGYMWRVTEGGMMQIGDACDEFDRWALCEIIETRCPTSADEFAATVSMLLEKKERALCMTREATKWK